MIRLNIPAQDAATALLALAQASRLTLAAPAEDLSGVRTQPVVGSYSLPEALQLMLSETSLVATVTDEGRILVRRVAPAIPATQPVFMRTSATAEPVVVSDGPGEAEQDLQLGEVLVTARKRAESLQVVPLSITALTSDTLANAGVESLRDVSYLTPGLTVQGDDTEREARPTIRGLNYQGDRGAEGNVSVFLDGVYISNAAALSFGLMDFERVEVVKGPVSALYGRNAFSGAINYVSKVPGEEFSSRVEATLGSDARYRGFVSVNAPIGERFAAKLALGYDTYDGQYRDPVNGTRLGGFEKKGADLVFRFKATDRLTFDGGAYVAKDDFGLPTIAPVPFNCAAPAGTTNFSQVCGSISDGQALLPLQAPRSVPTAATGNTRDVRHARLKATAEFDSVQLDLLAGWFDVEALDFSELNALRDGLPYTLVPGPGTVALNTFLGGKVLTDDLSFEARLASSGDQRLRWQVGGFTYESSQDVIIDASVNSTPIPAGQQIVCPARLACIWQTPGGEPSALKTVTQANVRQQSGFASVEFDLRDDFTLLTELRYTQERKKSDTLSNAAVPGVDPDGAGKSETWDFWNPRVSATWRMSPDHTFYVSAAKGTKAGGFNGNAVAVVDFAYDPENNWTYEIGAKNLFLDGKLRLNVAAFQIEWKGLQVQGPSSDPRSTAFVVKNLGSVRARGAELELATSLSEGVSLSGGVAYTRPIYNSDAFDFGGVATCRLIPTCAPRVTTVDTPQGPRPAVSLQGLLQQRVSQWQVSARLEANRPLAEGWRWFGSLGYSMQSKQFQQIQNVRWIDARHTGDLRAGVEYRNLRFTAWVENLFDDLTPYVGGGSNIRLNTLTFGALATIPEGRRYGITAVAKFD